MKNYELKCEHCGQMFEANRKNTKYCSDSCRVMASRERKMETVPDETTVLIKYSPDEYKKLSKTAKSFDLSVEEIIKFRGLTTLQDIEGKNKEIEALKKEVVRLKAHLSEYTKKPSSSGIFLLVDEFEKNLISNFLDGLYLLEDEENPTLEDKMIYLGMHCLELVDAEHIKE